jgi:hypothetical protein
MNPKVIAIIFIFAWFVTLVLYYCARRRVAVLEKKCRMLEQRIGLDASPHVLSEHPPGETMPGGKQCGGDGNG